MAYVIAAGVVGVVMGCFAEVGSRFDEPGGPYLYAKTAFGRLAGIEMGWLAYLARITATAANLNLLVIYLDGPVPDELVASLVAAGGRTVPAHNPYWDRYGVTIADPVGHRVVLVAGSWELQ